MNWKVLLIAGAAASLLFKDRITEFLNQSAAAAPSGQAEQPAPPTQTDITAANTVWGRILKWAEDQPGYDGLATTHEWNYAYAQVRGVAVPANDATAAWDWNKRISFDEYVSHMSAAGLSGVPAKQTSAAARAWGY